jgi:hypothetical protein
MRGRAVPILASAVLAGSLLVAEAEAHGAIFKAPIRGERCHFMSRGPDYNFGSNCATFTMWNWPFTCTYRPPVPRVHLYCY